MGPGRPGRHRLRADGGRRTRRRPVPRGHSGGGARVLHPALRRARLRGPAARAAGPRRCPEPRRGDRVDQAGLRPARRAQCRRRHRGAHRPTRRARPADRPTTRAATRRPRPQARGGQHPQAGDRRRGREDLAGQGLAQRRQPAARPARGVEGAPPSGAQARRRAVAPVLERAYVVHPAPQDPLRRARREARGRPGRQGAAAQGGRGAEHLDRVGADVEPLPHPDAGLEGRRGRAARGRGGPLAAASAPPRTPSSVPARPPTPSRTASSRPMPRRRRSSWSRPRRCSRSPTSRPPSAPSATSPSAGTPPARSRATR